MTSLKDDGAQASYGGFSERQAAVYAIQPEIQKSDDETTIGDIIRLAWRGKAYAFGGALALLLLALALLLVTRVALPKTEAYRTALTITMSGAEPGKYPNGADFAPSDLRSPSVLEAVFNENKLADFGLDLGRFSSFVSVEAYSPVFESLSGRYRARLENKTLSFEERKAIEDEFKTSLAALTGKGVMVTFAVPESSKVPDAVAQKVVADIPAKWADIFVNRLGVAGLPVPVSGTDLVDVKLMDALDFPLVYDYLETQTEVLRTSLDRIAAIPGAKSFVSATSGRSAEDLVREFNAVEQFRIKLGLKPVVEQGLSRDAATTSVIYSNQISALAKDAQKQADLAKRVTSVITEFRSTQQQAAAGADGAAGTPAGSTFTQFDGAFVDKIVELSKKGEGLDFEKQLLEKRLGYDENDVAINDRRSRLSERLALIVQSTLSSSDKARLTDVFVAGSAKAAEDLNRLWKDSQSLVAEINEKRLNFDKALYKTDNLPADVAIERQGLLTLWSMALLAGAALGGLIAGFAVYLIRKSLASLR